MKEGKGENNWTERKMTDREGEREKGEGRSRKGRQGRRGKC